MKLHVLLPFFLLAFSCGWVGCDGGPPAEPSRPEAATKAGDREKSAADEPVEGGITYFAIDATPNNYVSAGLDGKTLTLSPRDGTTFDVTQNHYGSTVFAVRPTTGDAWSLQLRAPSGKPFEVGMHADALEANVSDGKKAWLQLSAGTRAPGRMTGWFRVHECQYAPNSLRLQRFSVDFVMIEDGGARSFGRYRLRATVDPRPTAEETMAALYGEDVVANHKVGMELVTDRETEQFIWLLQKVNGRHPASLKELMAWAEQYHIDLPKLPAGKEFWYDGEAGRLYIRKAAAAE